MSGQCTPNFRIERIRCRAHLAFVGSLPCCVCKRETDIQVHHLLSGPEPKARGLKASDRYTVPVCLRHHLDIHAAGNERAWFAARNMDPVALAGILWAQSVAAGRAKP